MITSDQRKTIEKMAYDAIKAMTGRQLQLSLVGYSEAVTNGDNIISGIFELDVDKQEYKYLIAMDNSDIISVIRLDD